MHSVVILLDVWHNHPAISRVTQTCSPHRQRIKVKKKKKRTNKLIRKQCLIECLKSRCDLVINLVHHQIWAHYYSSKCSWTLGQMRINCLIMIVVPNHVAMHFGNISLPIRTRTELSSPTTQCYICMLWHSPHLIWSHSAKSLSNPSIVFMFSTTNIILCICQRAAYRLTDNIRLAGEYGILEFIWHDGELIIRCPVNCDCVIWSCRQFLADYWRIWCCKLEDKTQMLFWDNNESWVDSILCTTTGK